MKGKDSALLRDRNLAKIKLLCNDSGHRDVRLHHFNFKFKKVKTKLKNRNFKFIKLKTKFKKLKTKFEKLKTKFKNL